MKSIWESRTSLFDFASNKDGHLVTVHIERGYDVQAQAMRQVTITVYDPDGQPSQMFYADSAQAHGTDFHSWTLHNTKQILCKGTGRRHSVGIIRPARTKHDAGQSQVPPA